MSQVSENNTEKALLYAYVIPPFPGMTFLDQKMMFNGRFPK